MVNRDVLVSGAGVAGTALAYWLARHGFRPTVVERAPAPRAGGYAIDIRGAALDVVERMGVLDEVRAAAVDMRGMSYVDAANRPLVSVRGDLFGAADGSDVEIMRGDLTRILHAAAREGVEYRFADSVAALTQESGGVRVAFESGETRRFALVMGADGLHSTVRGLAFGDEAAFNRHLGCHISIFGIGNHLGLDHWTLLHNVPGKLAVIYSGRERAEAKAILCFASGPMPEIQGDSARQKRLLAETFAGEGWEVPRLVDALPRARDFYFDSVSQIHMDRWSNGRVVLVGDAGYCASPASGQGTSIALVGAYVLAAELAAHPDHRVAFARYESRMRGYVRRNQRIGTGAVKHFVPRTRWRIWLRNQLVRALPHLPARDRLAGGIQRAATAITLPDY